MKFAIRSQLGLLLYLIRRNDKSWAGLSSQDQQFVHEANQLHNNLRPDYAQPEFYQDGRNFESKEDRQATLEGKKLQAFLERTNPKSVLEIGPGSGFYTRLLVSHPSVVQYQAIDIASSFLDYLRPSLEGLKKSKPGFQFELMTGDFLTMQVKPVDAIIMYSTVHHIPNRRDLLRWVETSLVQGGHCFIYEPSHYLPRVLYLTRKFFRLYRKAEYRRRIESYSTHHFCTIEEFNVIVKTLPGLRIRAYGFHRPDFPHFSRKIVNRLLKMLGYKSDPSGVFVEDRMSLVRFFSQRMFVEFEKI